MKKIFAVGDQQWLGGLTPKLEEAQVGYRLAKTPKELASYLKKETPSVTQTRQGSNTAYRPKCRGTKWTRR